MFNTSWVEVHMYKTTILSTVVSKGVMGLFQKLQVKTRKKLLKIVEAADSRIHLIIGPAYLKLSSSVKW